MLFIILNCDLLSFIIALKGCNVIHQRRIQDSRRRGAPDNKFARFSEKMHEMKKILVHGGVLGSPLDPPLFTILNCGVCHSKITLKRSQFCIMIDIVNEKKGYNFVNDFLNDKKDHNIVNNKMFSSFGHKPDSLNVVIFWESYPILCTCFCNRNSIFKKTIRQ